MAKFEQPKDMGNGWTDWIQPIRRGYKMACCDCALVHNLDFRVKKGRAQFRVSRNNRSTAMMRRHARLIIRHTYRQIKAERSK